MDNRYLTHFSPEEVLNRSFGVLESSQLPASKVKTGAMALVQMVQSLPAEMPAAPTPVAEAIMSRCYVFKYYHANSRRFDEWIFLEPITHRIHFLRKTKLFGRSLSRLSSGFGCVLKFRLTCMCPAPS